MRLDGQRVVIIGGSSGIGLATAQLARAEGADITIAGRSEDRLREAQRALGECDVAALDIADAGAVEALFADLPRVDHVVVSAGTLGPGGIVSSDLSTLQQIVDQRIWGPIHAVRAAAPKMTGGSITFTSGGIASRPRAGAGMFTAALSTVEALPRALALELAPVRVNTVTPGVVDTPLQHTGEGWEERLRARGEALPVRRVGAADEIAAVMVMLMTNGYITGEVIHADGGGRFV
ncbi:MAG: SDR family oxidoreductase [Dehalococcoidia bacterium]